MFPKLPAALFLLVLCSFSNFSVAQEKFILNQSLLGGKQSDFITCKDIVVLKQRLKASLTSTAALFPPKILCCL